MFKKKHILLFSFLIALLFFNVNVFAADGINVRVNDIELYDTGAYLFYGRTIVPIAQVAEAMGADVSWDAKKR